MDTETSNENAIIPAEQTTGMKDTTILVAEDNIELANYMRHLLVPDYNVILASNGNEAMECIKVSAPDIVISDVMMPFKDGYELCSEIKTSPEFCHLPIILLTAKADDMDKLIGFDNGADDYLTKPFNILELKARIRALLRRTRTTAPAEEAPSNTLTIGSITLDLDARNAYRSGQLADLTAKEFDVIEFLMRNPNRVYSREALLDTIWAYEYRSDIRTVDVHIPGDDQFTPFFPGGTIVGFLMDEPTVGGAQVFCPLLFDVDQCPLTATEGEML